MNIYNLLWRRYYKVLLTVMVIILGVFIYQTSTQLGEWQSTNTFMHSQTFKVDYASDVEIIKANAHKTQAQIQADQKHGLNQPQYIISDKERKQPLTEAQFVKRGTQFFTKETKYMGPESYLEDGSHRDNGWFVAGMIIPMSIMFIFVLMFLLAEDNAQNFNLFLASTRFKRTKIMLAKMVLLVGGPLLAIAVGYGIYFATTYLVVPAQYYNIASKLSDFSSLFNAFGWILCVSMLFCLASVLIGKRFGSAFLTGLFLLSVQLLPQVFVNIKYFGHADASLRYANTTLRQFNKFIQTPQMGMALIVLALIMGLVAIKLFDYLSMERNDQFVMFRQLRWPLWIVILLYTAIVLATIMPSDSSTRELYLMLAGIWVFINAILYYLIFEPQSWRHPIKSIS